MKKYVFEKQGRFLKDDGTFTRDITEAKEIRLKWWEFLFQILSLLITLYGEGKLKRL